MDGVERLKKTLQNFKILPTTDDRQKMNEEERYLDYGFKHRISVVRGWISSVFFFVFISLLWWFCLTISDDVRAYLLAVPC